MSFLDWKQFGIRLPEILLPKRGVDHRKWSVVACDQYTSEPEYWENTENDVGECPSTLHQIIPEIYLENDNAKRAEAAARTMQEYADGDIFTKLDEGAILVKRTFADGKTRNGLMLSIDLEAYEYTLGAKSLIRSSEGTIVERIPPRLELRSKALIEYPHILLLLDDPNKTVIEPLFEKSLFESVYDFDLGWGGGHVSGNYIPAMAMGTVHDAFVNLLAECKAKYKEEILMLVGDGNHSLATAKEHWNNVKSGLDPEEIEDHPARFALLEIVNLHGSGISFEPIYRVLYDVPNGGKEELDDLIEKYKNKYSLELANLQAALDEYIKLNPNVKIDYVHGEETARKIGEEASNLAFFPEVISPENFFGYIIKDGSLPRKAFSIGSAEEKRFYLEGRFIKKT